MYNLLYTGITYLKEKLGSLLIHESESRFLPDNPTDLTLDILRKIERSFSAHPDLYPAGRLSHQARHSEELARTALEPPVVPVLLAVSVVARDPSVLTVLCVVGVEVQAHTIFPESAVDQTGAHTHLGSGTA